MNKSSAHLQQKRKILAHAIAVVTASACYVAPAYADKALEEVIVTAQKKDDTLQTVPMTVNAVTADTIAKYNLLDFKDIQSVTPGLTIKQRDVRTATIAMRGVNVLTDSAYGPGVAIYWNEMNYDIDSAFKSMYDIGQVEILRGPQGTLRGITAPAGAVTISTKGPNFTDVEGTIEQTIGERNLSNTQLGVSLPIIKDKLALRVAGLYDHNQDDDIKNITTGKTNSNLTRSGRLTLGFRPTDDLEASLAYQYMEANTAGTTPVRGCGTGNLTTCLGTFDRKSVDAGPDDNASRRQATVLHIDWNLGPYELTSITGYQDQLLNNALNLDAGNTFPTSNPLPVPSPLPYLQGVTTSEHIFTQEVRFATTDADFYNWTYGIFGTKTEANTGVTQNQPLHLYYVPLNLNLGYGSSPVDIALSAMQEGYAAFTNQSLQLTDRLEVQAGLRYQVQRQTNFMVVNATLPPAADSSSTGHAVTGSGSISYQWTDDMRSYLSYGRSYRAGGFTTAPSSPQDLAKYKPEYSDSIELGFKSRLANGRIQVNGDIYYQKYKDFLARTTDSVRSVTYSPTGVIQKVGADQLNYNADAVAQGAELQIDALITDDWKTGLGISYTDAKFTGGQAFCNLRDANNVVLTPTNGAEVNTCPARGRVAGEPNWGINASTEYTVRLNAVDTFARGLYTFSSGRPDDTAANSVLDTASYGLFNLFLGVRDKNNAWEVTLWAKNLFDHQGAVRYYSESTVAPTPVAVGGTAAFSNPDLRSGYSQVQLIQERQIGITGKYNFSI